jgi:eukaryotic-like serine/threonine-protein kinase
MPFGPYLLLKRVAVGGMAELFLAKDTRNGRFLVLKRILPYLAEEEEFVRMFLDEARIASALHHPQIVEVYELGRLEGSTFIAMEWVEGVDLRKVLQKEQARGGVIPPGIAAWLVARLCEGLHFAHEKRDQHGQPLGIVHRDISPQNVMLGFNANVKLVDFGIAKATAWMSRSKPGVIKGKFLYLAPEQLSQEHLDCRADLFAIGTLLYELTTGKSPFYRTSTEAVIYAIRVEAPTPPVTLKKGYPSALSRVVMKCLEKDREERFQSAVLVAERLDALNHGELPIGRPQVLAYIASLFGDEHERTHLYVPPNAQTNNSLDGVGDTKNELKPSHSHTNVDPLPFENLNEERTASLATERSKEPTPSTVSNRKQASAGDSIVTAPVMSKPTLRPNLPPYAAAGKELEDTALSISGSGTRSDEVTNSRPLRNATPEPAPGGAASHSVEVSRSDAAKRSRLAPPVPTSDTVPVVSDELVRSESENETLEPGAPPAHFFQADVDEGDDTLDERRRAKAEPQVEPVAASRERGVGLQKLEPQVAVSAATSSQKRKSGARPKTARPLAKSKVLTGPRPLPPVDADDLIETADSRKVPTEPASKRMLIALVMLAVSLMLAGGFMVMLFWPSTKANPSRKAPPNQLATEQKSIPLLPLKIVIKASAGTKATIEGVPVEVDREFERAPGPLTVTYECPQKRGKTQARKSHITVTPVLSENAFVLELPCN